MSEEKVTVLAKRNSADSLENFAKQIEEMFRKGKDQGPLALKRQVCRLLASPDPRIAAVMTAKWVEWRFGKAKETHEHKHDVKVEMTLNDAQRIIRGYFDAASGRANTFGSGDRDRTAQQDSDVLPS